MSDTENPVKQLISMLPGNPGVYQYYDKEGKLLYIGKAKNLKNTTKRPTRAGPTLEERRFAGALGPEDPCDRRVGHARPRFLPTHLFLQSGDRPLQNRP